MQTVKRVHAAAKPKLMSPFIDGQHLTLEELHAYTRPSNASVAAVTQWLQRHQGVESFSFTPSDSFVSVTLPLWQAERMLNTKFGIFKHENGAEILRTLETHLPEDVHPHISRPLVLMKLVLTLFGRRYGANDLL
jgi:hypothetical protein